MKRSTGTVRSSKNFKIEKKIELGYRLNRALGCCLDVKMLCKALLIVNTTREYPSHFLHKRLCFCDPDRAHCCDTQASFDRSHEDGKKYTTNQYFQVLGSYASTVAILHRSVHYACWPGFLEISNNSVWEALLRGAPHPFGIQTIAYTISEGSSRSWLSHAVLIRSSCESIGRAGNPKLPFVSPFF